MRTVLDLMLATTVAATLLFATAAPARAQHVGTFSWQTQPFCNVLTLRIVQHGPLFQVIGTDDLCGAGVAPVTGTAVPGGRGVVMGLAAAMSDGTTVHMTASIDLATLGGTWTDAAGGTGPFIFNGALTGSPRPQPRTISRDVTLNFAMFNVTIPSGACVVRSPGDSGTGVFRDGGTATLTFVTQNLSSNLRSNLVVVPGSPKSLPTSSTIGILPILFCNGSTLTMVLDQDITIRAVIRR